MQSFNIIEGLEEQSYSWSKVSPRKMSGTTTGETETLNFTGSTLSMKSLAQHFLAEGSAAVQVSCTVTRQEADMARLTVTRTYYGSGSSEDEPVEPENPDTPDQGQAGEAGSSEANPLVEFDYTEVQQPILTHPLVVAQKMGAKHPSMIALRMFAQGSDENQTFSWGNSGELNVNTVGEALGAFPDEVIDLVGSQQFYLDVIITASVKWEIEGTAALPNFGQVPRIESPPNAIQLTGNRNWLFCGGRISVEGDRVYAVKNYKASDANGWNPVCYASS